MWSINDDISRMQWVQQVEECIFLPSDSSKRPDAHHILNQEWDEAEAAKELLEDAQRNDKRLRMIAEQQGKTTKNADQAAEQTADQTAD